MNVDYQVIKRYLDGHEKEGDKELLVGWFSVLAAEKDLKAKYKHFWSKLPLKEENRDYDSNKVLGRIYHEIKLEESNQLPAKSGIIRIVNVVSKIAAVLFIPLAVFVYVSRNNILHTTDQTAFSEIYSPLGTRTKFYLPDGSGGWLNGGSSLKFPASFRGKSREVILEGEAYFDIQSNPRKPFVVTGTNISVIAYGTSFNVMVYPEDRQNEVTLAHGSIIVKGRRNGTISYSEKIKPGQMIISDKYSESNMIVPVDVIQVISWKDGQLSFRGEPFKEIVKKINRWYNVSMIIKDEVLESYSYLATFEDETLDEVLKLLTLSSPIVYKDKGRIRQQDGTYEKRVIELYYKP